MRRLLFVALSAALLFPSLGIAVNLPAAPTNESTEADASKVSQSTFAKTAEARLKQWEAIIPQVKRAAADEKSDAKQRQKILDLANFMAERDASARKLLPRVVSASKSEYKNLQQKILAELGAMEGRYTGFQTAE